VARDDEFAEFVAARYRALVRTGLLLTGDSGRAEDLVQSALIRTYLAWIRWAMAGGIAVGHLSDHLDAVLKPRQRGQRVPQDLHVLRPPVPGSPSRPSLGAGGSAAGCSSHSSFLRCWLTRASRVSRARTVTRTATVAVTLPGPGCACLPVRTAGQHPRRTWRPSPAGQYPPPGPGGPPSPPGDLGYRHDHLLRQSDLARQPVRLGIAAPLLVGVAHGGPLPSSDDLVVARHLPLGRSWAGDCAKPRDRQRPGGHHRHRQNARHTRARQARRRQPH